MASLLGALVPRPRNDAQVPLVSRAAAGMFSGLFQRRDAAGQLGTMATNGTVFGVVNRTSTAVAKTEWKLYRKAASGKDEDRTPVTNHAFLDLINKPNPFYSRMELFEVLQQHLDLTGEAFLLVSRNQKARSIPLELWPIRPDRMTPVAHPTKYLTGWAYTSPDGERVPLDIDEVIQVRTPNPSDPYRGLGPVQAVLTDILGSQYAAEWNANFFRNSAEPGGIIEIDKRLSDEEFDELSARWDEQHRGVAHAHRVAILEQGHWVDRKYTQRDMEFSSLRGVTRDAIMEGFGFPKPMLGVTEDVNRATAIAGKAIFAEWLTVPRCDRWRDALGVKLLPMYGATSSGLEVDYDSPVPEDEEAENAERTSKADAVASLVAVGFDGNAAATAYELPDGLVWNGMPTPPAPQSPAQMPAPGSAAGEPGAAPPDDTTTVEGLLAGLLRNSTPAVLNAAGWPERDTQTVDAVDLSPVQAAWEAALAALLALWARSVVSDWVHQLLDQIRTVLRGDGGSLTTLKVDSTAAAGHLAQAMSGLAETAAGHAVAEAARQDVTLQPAWPTAHDLAAAAEEIAAFEGQRYALTAGREAARVRGPGVPDGDVVDHVRGQLEQLSANADASLGGALTQAQNRARVATFKSGPVGALYATEAMDSNTCLPCREIHGRFICTTDDLAPLYALYPVGGYIDCLGRWRCRGSVTGVWRKGTDEGGQ